MKKRENENIPITIIYFIEYLGGAIGSIIVLIKLFKTGEILILLKMLFIFVGAFCLLNVVIYAKKIFIHFRNKMTTRYYY